MAELKYPIGVQSFEVLREEDFVYVDKTDLVYKLAQQHVCFLCRPRRFGKSLTMSTLEAYFSGKRHLFKGLKIEQLEQDWKVYPVFHIDFNGGAFYEKNAVESVLQSYILRWEMQYHLDTNPSLSLGIRFAAILHAAYQESGLRCVVLVDEYDKPMLDVLGTEMEDMNRTVLKDFYSVFKLADADLRFVLLTGVTKFSQVSVFSGFNQPSDISMTAEYETLCGITESELHECFDVPIGLMAEQYHTTKEMMYAALKQRYDGYHFSIKMVDVYNPFSIINALSKQQLSDYWFQTGTPTYLIRLLEGENVNLQMLLQNEYEEPYFANYRASKEDPLAMLYQSGYLTIKSVRVENFVSYYCLDFPNVEVRGGFMSMLAQSYFQSKDNVGSVCRQMVDCLRKADLDALHTLMNAYLSKIDYAMRKDKEYHFQYTFYLIFSLLSTYLVKVEQHNSQGRLDMIVETHDHIYIFEFKLDGTAEDALQQIEERQYALPYATDQRPLYKIGASFGRNSGVIDDWKVE